MPTTEAKDDDNKFNTETNKDLYDTFNWYQKEAENGDIEAQSNLATLYYEGEETEKNLEKAYYWYQKAAENGDITAQYNLATLYYYGQGTEKNLEKAFY